MVTLKIALNKFFKLVLFLNVLFILILSCFKVSTLSCNAICEDFVLEKHQKINGLEQSPDEKIRQLKVDLGDEQYNKEILYSIRGNDNQWSNYSVGGKYAGKNVKNFFIEAIKIKLIGDLYKKYNIWYRAKVENQGWLGWARNGEICGSVGANLAIKELEIKLLEKDSQSADLKYTRPPAIIRVSRSSVISESGGRSKVIKFRTKEGIKYFKSQERVTDEGNIICWKWLAVSSGKEFFDSKIRNIATKRIAELLGLERIIAKCQMVTVKKIGDPDTDGLLTYDTAGIDFWPFRETGNKNITPSFIKNLYNLEILDGICSQLDRCPWNYSIIRAQNGDPINVVGYDNDLSFGAINDLKNFRYWGCFLINHNGQVNLPHMDKELAEKILTITNEQVEAAIFDILEPKYVESTKIRFKQVQEAIKETIIYRKNFLLDSWGKEAVNDDKNFSSFTYPKLFKERIG